MNDMKRNVIKIFVIMLCGVVLLGCSSETNSSVSNEKSDLDIVREVFKLTKESSADNNAIWTQAELEIDGETFIFQKFLTLKDNQKKQMAVFEVSEEDLIYQIKNSDGGTLISYNTSNNKTIMKSNEEPPKMNMEDVLKEKGITIEQMNNALEQYAKEVENK